ncbi:MAG: type VI secretion system contractile sheath large subunit [Planctomycetia bacterium]|nr:type VI secretion system contractile sheath large subunit [Planctomycetia bacterium]
MDTGLTDGAREASTAVRADQRDEGRAAPAAGARSLVDSVVEATDATRLEAPGVGEARSRLEAFHGEPSPWRALVHWIGPANARLDKRHIAGLLGRDIARLDELISRQVNAILHHRRFQELEASWRGLHYLVNQIENADVVKVRVLSVSWKELTRDLQRAIEFDQSQLFRKIYSDEYGTAGGEPFGVLLGDYEIWSRPCAEHPTDDVETLRMISGVAAAAFAPFIAAAHPSLLGLNDFSSLERAANLSATFDQLEYLKWRALREREDSRFVGLTLPRVLMRLPYEDDGSRVDGFVFREEVAGPDRAKYLWGNAAYAFGAVLARSFAESGWLADIRGVRRDVEGGGLVTGLPVHSFNTDKRGVAPKCSTDVIVSDHQEQELSELGFLPLCDCAATEYSAFYAAQSAQKPKQYDDPAATTNARVSSMLHYTLCVSVFAHYLKAVARDKVGAFNEASEVEDYLHLWLQKYVTSDAEAGSQTKAELPLRAAEARVFEQPDKPGSYLCVARLWPHYELDDLVSTLRIKTELTPSRAG